MNRHYPSILLLFFFISFWNKASAVEMEMSLGTAKINYSELHQDNPIYDLDLNAYYMDLEGEFRLKLGTKLLQITGGYQYVEQIGDAAKEIDFWNYNFRFIFKIPSKPFNLDLIAEYVADASKPDNETYGFNYISGIQYWARLSAFLPMYNFSIELNYPVQLAVEGYEHYNAVIKYYLAMMFDSNSYEISSGTYIRMEVEYKKIEDTTTAAHTIFKRVRNYSLSIGFSF